MSLTRRLQLLLALLLMLALATNLWLQVQRTRDFLALQLQTHAQDTATSLALSLAPALAAGDLVTAERMIDAVFDRGYFRQIRWQGVNGEPMLNRDSSAAPAQVPSWFSALLPIRAPISEALLSAGWQQHGKLEVMSHTGYAELSLWRSFVDLLLGSLLALLALGILVVYTVQRALAPLHRMADAAHQFVSRRAPMQLPTAVVNELQPLALALGQMSEQVAAQFAAQATQLQGLQQQLQQDNVTQLPNRLALLDQLSQHEQSAQPMQVLALRLGNLASINAELGYAGTNTALQALAAHLQLQRDWQWFRLSGSEFVALPAATTTGAATTIATAHKTMHKTTHATDAAPDWLSLPPPLQAHAVQLSVDSGSSAGAVLARLDAALNEAQQRNMSWWPIAASETLSAEAWRERLQQAIAQPRFRFLPADIDSLSVRAQPAVEWLARLPQTDGADISAGQLLAQAHRLGLDLALENALLQSLAAQAQDDRHWHVNISGQALTEPGLRRQLSALARSRRLSLEMSESEALALPELAKLLPQLRAEGVGFGIDQVALSAGLLTALPRWRPDYLKLGLGLAAAGADSPLIASLTRLAQALDIAVLVPVSAQESSEHWRLAGVDGLIRLPN